VLVEPLFLLSVVIVLYTYAGHPALLYALARLRPRQWSQGHVRLSVAVYISAFNEEKGIATKVRNLLEQDYPAFEVIVVDDGSTDRETPEVLAVLEQLDRVRVVRQAVNSGPSAARNRAIAVMG